MNERLLVQWHDRHMPLPVRIIGGCRPLLRCQEPPPWLTTGPVNKPFDFCGHMRRLIADIVTRCNSLAHIDASCILLGVTQARNGRSHGLQARITPLRFPRGELTRKRCGRLFQVQRYFHNDREYLYLLTFCLPRFLDQDFSEKFITLFHELYHIGPDCNGDLRRHRGRYALHTRSERSYDKLMAQLAREYLARGPDADLHAFLRLDFAQLIHRHGAVTGYFIPRPKVIPVACPVPSL
jgi:hypothetical protein